MAGKRFSGILAAAAVAVLPACNLTPDYEAPQQELGAGFRNSGGESELAAPPSRWWESFNSDELNALVAEALANNHDIKAATARIAQAEAKTGVATSALLPTLKAEAINKASGPRAGIAARTTSPEGKSENLHQYGLSASYELDVWGKNRASRESALASARSNVFDREVIAITLVSDVVTTYFQYLQAKDREAVARSNIENMSKGLEAVRERARIGEGTDVELAQQRHALAQAEALLPPIRQQAAFALDKLALLLGKPPSALELKSASLDDLQIPRLSPGMPSDLLTRRPDIRKAEASLQSANADIGVARASMLPSFSLTGERGYGAQTHDILLSPMSIYWSLASNVTATIFDFGKSSAQIDQARAKYDELVANYQKTIISSLRDVEDALAAIRFSQDHVTAQQAVIDSAHEAHALSQESFNLGMLDYMTLLDTERSQYQAEEGMVQARFDRLSAAVSLFKAVGGETELAARPAAAAPPAIAPASVPPESKPQPTNG
ncbi:MAG: efflux transporter outer membrane subunit [Magnetospirillum sp.]|nr:efflux transporter outer membrane subunit [Magnetospirillum sp.]